MTAAHRVFVFLGVVAAFYAPDGDVLKIACIGDSITYGGGDEYGYDSYPTVLQKMLGPAFETFNFGVSGTTAMSTEDAWKVSTKFGGYYAPTLELNASIVIFQLGTNDAKVAYWNETRYLDEYLALIKEFERLQPEPYIILMVPPPYHRSEGEKWGERETSAINTRIPIIIPSLAEEHGYDLVNNFVSFGGLNTSNYLYRDDQIHPDKDGLELMAQGIFERLDRALGGLTVQPSAKPTPAPTYRPTRAPTYAPSPLPTAHPTSVPTTATPSLSPTISKLPTVLPSMEPTLSFEPTTSQPSHEPTTAAPSLSPSPEPSTAAPSTPAPTSMPSTSMPSTAPPSLAPSPGLRGVVELEGVGTFGLAEKKALIGTIALVCGLDEQSIELDETRILTTARRRLALSTAIVNFAITSRLSAEELDLILEDSVISGSFDSTLQRKADEFDASGLATARAVAAHAEYFSQGSSSGGGGSTNAMMLGLVAILALVLICVGLAVAMLLYHRSRAFVNKKETQECDMLCDKEEQEKEEKDSYYEDAPADILVRSPQPTHKLLDSASSSRDEMTLTQDEQQRASVGVLSQVLTALSSARLSLRTEKPVPAPSAVRVEEEEEDGNTSPPPAYHASTLHAHTVTPSSVSKQLQPISEPVEQREQRDEQRGPPPARPRYGSRGESKKQPTPPPLETPPPPPPASSPPAASPPPALSTPRQRSFFETTVFGSSSSSEDRRRAESPRSSDTFDEAGSLDMPLGDEDDKSFIDATSRSFEVDATTDAAPLRSALPSMDEEHENKIAELLKLSDGRSMLTDEEDSLDGLVYASDADA